MFTRSASLPVSLKLALRELRGGLSGFKIFMACLILGVTAIASIGSLTHAIQDGMQREGQSILGGDIEINIFQAQAGPNLEAWMAAEGEVSTTARFRTMARVDGVSKSTLSELRAVDDLYPLYGTFKSTASDPLAELLAKQGDVWGTVIDPLLADKLEVSVGDKLVFGRVTAEVRALIETEPDKANLGFQLGPSAFLDIDALNETGLVTTGSLINYLYRIKVPNPDNVKAIRENLKEAFPDARWRVRDRTTAAPGLRRFIDQMGMFLTLVGIAALVVGGVGVGNAVRGYMDRKTKTIATFKILGADGSTIFKVYFYQIMIIGLLAITIGLTVGAMLPGVLAQLLPDSLPVKPEGGIYPLALIQAATYGIMITIAFTVWPLGKARDLPAVHLFRSIVSSENKWPRKRYISAIAIAGITVVGLAVGLSTNMVLAAFFIVGAGVTLGILRLTSWLIIRFAARLPRPKNAIRRMAIANLHRPGAATNAVVVSMGLGLTLFASISLIEGNLDKQISEQVPEDAPAFFMVDIQPSQIDEFKSIVNSVEGMDELVITPNLRGRVIRLNDTLAQDAEVDPEVRWILRGDRGLTYQDTLEEGSTIVEGEWWPEGYSGEPEISLGKEAADGLGLTIGDTMTIAVLGREITATIRSIREINWGSFGFNFVIIFDPHTLKAAPHTLMATIRASGEAEATLNRQITSKFANITAIRMKEVLSSVNNMMDQIGQAIEATALVAIAAGVLVLAGAIAAGFRQRVYESVILKVVGAVRSQVLKAYLMEYTLIGVITAVISLGLGSLVGWLVVEMSMELEFSFLTVPMLITVAGSLGFTILLGLSSSLKALSIKPNEVLRNE